MESAIQLEIEEVYARLKAGAFLPALEALGRLLPSDDDPAVGRAVGVFLDEFFRGEHSGSPHEAQVLEKLLLLDRSDRIDLVLEQRQDVVLRLVRMHESEPELAVSYARFLPDHPLCRSLIDEAGPARVDRMTAAGAPVAVHRVGVPERPPDAAQVDGPPDALRSLYRSDIERRFHHAAVEVFPHYLVVPNVALHSVVDFEAIRHRLSEDERTYFFRALVDVVVFDPVRDLRPVYLFELDSPFHDDTDAERRDAMKDRIVEAAGASLYRIRPSDARVDRAVFKAAIRRITRHV